MIVDFRQKRPLDRFQVLYGASIHEIRTALKTTRIDEGIAIAVFLILFIDVLRAELSASRYHLYGLHLLLQTLQRQSSPLVDFRGVGVSPLVMTIWRIAIRLDFTTSLYLLTAPVFPAIPPEQQDLHRSWIQLSTPDIDAVEWSLATFALDNLMHRACHLAVSARELRKSSQYGPAVESAIVNEAGILLRQWEEWYFRPVIARAANLEKEAQFTLEEPSPWVFPRHRPRKVLNPYYANLCLQSCAIKIYISLIIDPFLTETPHPERFFAGMEYCSILAGLGEDSPHKAASLVWTMFLAGVGLGGMGASPSEAGFLYDRVKRIAEMFPLMREALTEYHRLWSRRGDFWNEMEKIKQKLY
jgi:hypothetical protein